MLLFVRSFHTDGTEVEAALTETHSAQMWNGKEYLGIVAWNSAIIC